MINFRCPSCNKGYQAPLSQAGTKVHCPQCGQKIMVPNVRNQTVLGVVDPPAGGAARGAPLPPPPAWMNPGAAAEPPPPDAQQYYIARGGQRYGPYTEPQFQQLSQSGNVRDGDRVWVPASRAWVASEQVGQAPPPSRPAAAAPSGGFPRGLVFGLIGAAAVCLLLVGGIVVVAVAWPRQPVELAKNDEKPTPKKDDARPAEDKTKIEKEPTVEEVVARSEKSVALIRTASGSGTGFVVGPNLLATNAHVIRNNFTKEIKVSFPSAGEAGKKERDILRVLHYHDARDLAVLEMETDLPPLPIEREAAVAKGQTLLAIGNPGLGGGGINLKNALSKGVYSTDLDQKSGRLLQMNISINPGNSGGPVLSLRGKVIGVVTSRAKREEAIGFAIPARDLATAVDRVKAFGAAERDKAAARYDARMVVLRTLPAAKRYLGLVGVLSKRWGEAINGGRPYTAEDARQLRHTVDEDYRKSIPTASAELRDGRLTFALLAREDVRGVMRDIGPDERLPDTMRRELTELWTVYTQLRGDYHNPIGTHAEYVKRLDATILTLERLEQTLRIALGIVDEELR